MATRTKTSMGARFTRLSETRQKWIIRLVTLAFVLVVWEIVGRLLGNLFLAPFSDVATAYIDLALHGDMLSTLLGSLRTMLIAYAFAVVVGVPVGLLMGRIDTVRDLIGPWVSAMFVTATASLLPLFIIVFGIDFRFRAAIVFFSCIWFILLNSYYGARDASMEFIDVGRSFGASRTKILKDIILPETFPFIFAGLRMGLIQALRGLILAETFIAFGYGGLIHSYSQQSADTAPILALILTIVIFGYALRVILQYAQTRLFPWSDTNRSVSR